MHQILLATQNPGKIAEATKILQDFDHHILTVKDIDLPPNFDPQETGKTFEQNALIKAKAFALATNLPSLADDTGLMVDALDGRPGVYSKRYGDDDQHRIKKLLAELDGVGESQRTARFVSSLCLYDPLTDSAITVQGTVEGRISFEPKGDQGFGYDPIFIPTEGDGRTFAQLGTDFKNKISHRARALKKLKSLI